MKKIISLFKRNYDGDRLVYDEIVPDAEWVIEGKGIATLKMDGTACMVREGVLYKRYDRSLTKSAKRRKKKDHFYRTAMSDFKEAPLGWISCEPFPNLYTGHWPGWVPVSLNPEDEWFREAFDIQRPEDGTYELIGPKIQGNPYGLARHYLHSHGSPVLKDDNTPPRDFEGVKKYLEINIMEGIVWYKNHELGTESAMVKIKRKDFGFPWPVKENSD